MRKMSFVGGQTLLLNGVRIVLRSSRLVNNDEIWEIFNESQRFHESITRAELDEALRLGKLHVPYDDPVPGEAQRRKFKGTRLISDLPAHRQKAIQFERKIVQEVERRTSRGAKTSRIAINGIRSKHTVLSQLLTELGREFGPKILGKVRTVSVPTYYEWANKHGKEVDADRIAGGYDRRGAVISSDLEFGA